jgi:hypothetical protein
VPRGKEDPALRHIGVVKVGASISFLALAVAR